MNIYDKDDNTLFASVPITKDAVHEEEQMVSNFVKLSWYGKKRRTLPVGAYVVPFSDGVRYRLFDQYSPRSEKYGKFKYEPEFQHPVMWLGRIPFIHLEGDTTSWETAVKRYDWTYSGPPQTIAGRLVAYINWLSTVMPSFGAEFGSGWTARVNGDLPPNAVCSFATLDVLSAAAEMANQFGCEYHFDFQSKMFLFGKIDWNKYGGSPYVLKSGDNVGVVSVSESKEPYANCFVVNGGTKNLSKLDGEGGYVQVNQRLTLDEDEYPDSIIDTREDGNEPILVRQLVFDDIYPKLELYVYRPRERKCWFLTSDGERVEDEERGILDPTDNKKYKYYSKWYVRLAYKKDNEWVDYELTEERMIKDKKPMLSFEVNPDYHTYDSALAGKEFEVVYFEEDRHETADNVNDEDFIAYAGDYRIEFYEDSNNVIIPTTSVDGLCPKGDYYPDEHNNKASMYNVVVDDAYKDVAREELYNEAMRTIRKLRSDLNTYTFPSNPLLFKEYDPMLYIGQSVVYDDGQDLNGGTSYRLETHVRKLTTRLDKPYIQTIVVGNEKRKGAVSSMKDQIDTFISGGYGGGSGDGIGGTTLTEDQFQQLIETYGGKYFLSKVHDDVAQGVIGFMKGIWFGAKKWFIDGNGNANFNDTTVNGLLKAYNAMINNVRSTNYTGDGILDSGWRITNEYEGYNSKATFDFLYIRKKAIFEELEIRKLSHIGGNFCLSGASGRVWKVDYMDADGNLLGYDTYTVPWTLASRIMMLFKPHNANNRYLGRRKNLQRRLTDAEKLLVRTVRCYMYNDDGTTTTMNNWTVGAQARCQTFNVEEQMEFDGSSWKGKKVGNTYWYRLVTAVSAEPVKLEDGQYHHWVEFSVDQSQEGTAYAWADALSDLPSRGDVFVQLGHRTRQDQSNVIMLETANEDSPAIKMYAGVNWWTYGPDKLVALMSPNGWRVVSNKFEWITQYGERFQTTVNRGVWVEIPVDDQGNRKCYYNDMVSHNGAYWRCIVGQDTYTIDEPSETSSAWSKEVYAALAPYVKLSEALVAVPCEANASASSAFSKTIVPKLMVTNLECTITSITLDTADSHVYLSGGNIVVSFASGASVTNKDYTVTLEGDLDGNHYTATDNLSVYAIVRGNDAYDVMAQPNTMIFTQQKDPDYKINLDGSEYGNSSTQVSVTMDGVAQPFRITNVVCTGRDGSGDPVGGITATYSNTSGRAWITHIPNNVEKGEMAVTISYGSGAQQTLILQFYCNLIGTWQEQVVGDTKTEIATKTAFEICDETGQVIGTTTLANYTKSSSQQAATLTKTTTSQGQQITAINEWERTAEGNFASINDGLNNRYTKSETATLVNQSISSATQGMVTTSNFEQTATGFHFATETYATNAAGNIKTQLKERAGIDIDSQNVDLFGNRIRFYDSTKSQYNAWIDPSNGTLHAVNGDFSGKVTATEGAIGGFTIGTNKIGDYDTRNGSVELNDNGSIRIFNRNNSYGMEVMGGVYLAGYTTSGTTTTARNILKVYKDTDRIDLEAGTVQLGRDSNSQINVKGKIKDATFDYVVFDGNTCFSQNNFLTGSGSVNLPTNRHEGMIIFAKGTTGSLTVKGNGAYIRTSSGAEIVQQVGGDKRSRFFLWDGSHWNEFYCE